VVHELRENCLAKVHPSLSEIDTAWPPAVSQSHSRSEKVQIEKFQNSTQLSPYQDVGEN
jgi:hypothetical protein